MTLPANLWGDACSKRITETTGDYRPNIGALGDEETALRFVVDRLVQHLRPLSIRLFGGRADGRARPDSDLELLVVLDDDAPDDATTPEAVYAPLCGSGIGGDVIPVRMSELTEVLHDTTNPGVARGRTRGPWLSAERIAAFSRLAKKELDAADRLSATNRRQSAYFCQQSR